MAQAKVNVKGGAQRELASVAATWSQWVTGYDLSATALFPFGPSHLP